MKTIRLVLAGPSGAGKDTLRKKILERRNDIFFNVSYTTREKRDDEIEGIDYHFVTKEKFQEMVDNNEFLEHVNYSTGRYGTCKIPEDVLKNKDILFRKDVRGAISLKEKFPYTLTFYILPKDKDRLKKQKGDRGEDRDKIALEEVELAKKLDFLIINDDPDKAVDEILNIIDVYKNHSMMNSKNTDFLDEYYK